MSQTAEGPGSTSGGGAGAGLRCLATGATGYVGGRLVPELLDAGHRVRCLARSPDRLRDHPWAGNRGRAPGSPAHAAPRPDRRHRRPCDRSAPRPRTKPGGPAPLGRPARTGAGLAGRSVHEPWRLAKAARAAYDAYPDPIVDLSEALDRFRRARGRD